MIEYYQLIPISQFTKYKRWIFELQVGNFLKPPLLQSTFVPDRNDQQPKSMTEESTVGSPLSLP
uniref:hypothetical protein n=1 Tax=Algoriphagus sp. TaxID=1872435 RepID=UPI004048E31D